MTRAELITMARHNMAHTKAGTIDQEPEVLRVPGHHYYDPERWQRELERVFKRMPLMLGLSTEFAAPGDFKSMDVVGVPLFIVRHADGDLRAYINSCSHRGAQVVTETRGNSKRFSCPYHAWTYDHDGDLVAIYRERDFGSIDKSCKGLTALPVAERANLVWVTLDPMSTLDIDTFLCGYDDLLANFGFGSWQVFDTRTIDGPNWKIAYDGYMDLYHLSTLHKATIGTNMSSQALYYAWGPHQRVVSPDPSLLEYESKPESEWSTAHMMASVWTIFPHVSIAGFSGGGRSAMISQLFPGETPLESRTVQNYVMQELPATDEAKEQAVEQFKLLEYVVREEDYATGLRQQRALMSRPNAEVIFGRNEGGGHRFHGFVERLLQTEDADLPSLFTK